MSSQTNVSCFSANNGIASVSVTGGPFTYSWSTGATNTSISNLGPGTYSLAVISPSCTVSGVELVTNGNFSSGNTGFSSSYNYTPPPNTAAAQYWIATGAQASSWNGGLASAGDHTSGTGNFMMVNGSSIANTNVWCQTIPVTPNTNYNFSTWVSSLYLTSPAQLQFSINGIALGPVFNAPPTLNTWSQFFSVWNSGINTSANICIVNQNTNSMGNDFGLDDISFQSCSSCSAVATFTITEPAALTVTVTSTNANCSTTPGSAIVSASGGTTPYSYLWTPGGQSTSTISVISSGMQSVTVTDANNCSTGASTNITVLQSPNAVAGNNSPVCVNNSFSLTSSGGSSYFWTGPDSFTSTTQNPTFTAANLNMSGTYSVLVSSGTCTAIAVTNVIVNPLPTPGAISNNTVCLNNLVSLSSSGGSLYYWSGPSGFISSVQNPTFIANSLSYSGDYSLTVTDNKGCNASTVVSITVNPLPDISISIDKKKGCAPLCNTIVFSSTTNNTTFNWNLGNGLTGSTGTVQPCFNNTGIYTISSSAVNNFGCSSVSTSTVQVFPQPVSDFIFAPLKPILNKDDVHFTDASHNATIISWSWYFYGTATHTSQQQNPVFYYPDAGTYPVTLVVKSDHGCIDTITKVIVVGEDFGIYVPNAFTPNGDGINDIFQPKGFGIKDYELDIFDRWGERIYNTKVFAAGWDGKHHRGLDYGTFCKDDIYIWKIKVVNVFGEVKYYTGHVTLIK